MGDKAELKEVMFACKRDQMKRSVELMLSGDFEAYKKFLFMEILQKRCISIQPGTIIVVEERSVWDGIARVRAKGDTESWWVPYAILKADAAKRP